jgi:N-methylhydantoinase A
MSGATARIGVDVGGTFTDFVLHDPARNLVATGKRLTTPDDPSEAIVAGIARLLEETGLKPGDLPQCVCMARRWSRIPSSNAPAARWAC